MTVAVGFYSLQNMMNDTVVSTGTDVILQAVRESAMAWNMQAGASLSVFTQRTMTHGERVLLPGSGTLEPLDEWGNPQPRRPSGYYQTGYPIQGGGYAWGTNRVSRALMKVVEAQRATENGFMADMDWLRRHVIAAMVDNTSWTFTDKLYPNDPSVTVVPLANGDSVVYQNATTTPATDNHYVVQGAAIDDSHDPFPALYSELDEHPSNSGPYYAYVASNIAQSAQNLTAVIPVSIPGVIYGSGVSRTTLEVNTDNKAVVSSPTGLGQRFLGLHECGIYLIEWNALPNDTIVGHASGATSDVTDGTGVVLKMREYPATGLQGLFPETADIDGNLYINRLIRYAGFGVANRVAAAIVQIDSDNSQSGVYSIPSGFSTPLPV